MAVKYYAMIDGRQKGPYALEELPGAGVRPSTYIWCKGMSDWQKAEDNADVCRLFRNHLYDLMHPGRDVVPEDKQANAGPDNTDSRWKIQPDQPKDPHASRFDAFLQQAGEDKLPSLEEIESREDTSKPPMSMVGYAWLVTIFCCIPTGIVALVFAYKSKSYWKKGDKKGAYDYNRKAKMWTGISFCLGLIGYGLFMALSM